MSMHSLPAPLPVRRAFAFLLAGPLLALSLSAAPLGVSADLLSAALQDQYILDTDPEHDAFKIDLSVRIQRNQFVIGSQMVTFRYRVSLTPANGGGAFSTSHSEAYAIPGIYDEIVTPTVELNPSAWVSDQTAYTLDVEVFHIDDPDAGSFMFDDSGQQVYGALAHFSGVLNFGATATTLNEVGEAPPPIFSGNGEWDIVVADGALPSGLPFATTTESTPNLHVGRDPASGDLTVLEGSVEVTDDETSFPWGDSQGWRGTVLLSPDGLAAQHFMLGLPPGLGWRNGPTGILSSVFHSGAVALPLNPDLTPAGPANGPIPPGREFVTNCLPVAFTPPSFTFDGATLTLATPGTRFLRSSRYQQHLALTGELPRSNDSYLFHLANAAVGNLVVTPGTHGGINVALAVNAGDFTAHFPDADVGGTGAIIQIVNNAVDPEASPAAAAWVHLQYDKACPLTGNLHNQGMRILDPELSVTPQGGLVAAGDLATHAQFPNIERHLVAGLNQDGNPVHETDPFAAAEFYMPGFCAPDEGPAVEANPVRFVLAESQPASAHALGYPGSEDYADGLGLYAGFNFFHVPDLRVHSRVGGESPLTYALFDNAKFYGRWSGASGIVEADPGEVPFATTIYSFPIFFTDWGFNLLSNVMQDSYIDGQVDLTGTYAGFVQAMEEVRIRCCGNLEDFNVPQGTEPTHSLSYWTNSRFDYAAVRFETPGACDDDRAALTYAATATVNGLPGPKSGYLRFLSDGNMTVPSDPDFEASALTLLPQGGLHGQYYFVPDGDAYFSNPEENPGEEGFVTFRGDLDVAFFEDLRVRGFTQANPNAPEDRLVHYFHGDFLAADSLDASHAGLPGGSSLAAYRQSASHLPHARGSFFGKQDTFDFPVSFSVPTGNFYSAEDQGVDVLILETEGGVDRLNAELAQIHFGVRLEGPLELTVGGLIEKATEHGVQGLADVIGPQIADPIKEGLLGLAETLDNRLESLLRPALEQAILPDVVAPLAQQLQDLGGSWDGNAAQLGAVLDLYFGAAPLDGGLLEDALDTFERFNDGLGQIAGVTEELRARLEKLQTALDCAVALMGGDLGEHEMEVLGAVFGFLVERLEGNPDVLAIQGTPAYDDALDSLFDSANLGWLADAREALIDLRNIVGQIHDVLAQGEEFFNEIQNVFDDATAVVQAVKNARFQLQARIIAEMSVDIGDFSIPELEEAITVAIADQFFESLLSVKLQSILRSRFSYLDTAVHEALTTALQAISDAILEALEASGALDGIQDALSSAESLLGMLSVVKSIGLRGEAITTDDRIRQLLLQSKAEFGFPTPAGITIPMEAEVLFEYLERRSDGSSSCSAGHGAVMPEVTLSASGGTAVGFGADSKVGAQVKFTFNDDLDPTGFAGSFEIKQSKFGVSGMGIHDFSGTLALGGPAPGVLETFYLGAFARGNFGAGGTSVDLEGGFWLGQTCSAAPLAFYPNFPHLPAGDPVKGFAAYMSGKAPLAGGSCLFNITVGADIGGFAIANALNNPMFGGLLGGSVSGELLCLAKAEGSLLMTYDYLGGTHRFNGDLDATLRLGRKPFAIEKSKSFGVEYIKPPGGEGDWNVNP